MSHENDVVHSCHSTTLAIKIMQNRRNRTDKKDNTGRWTFSDTTSQHLERRLSADAATKLSHQTNNMMMHCIHLFRNVSKIFNKNTLAKNESVPKY